jgi:hypothetical protein
MMIYPRDDERAIRVQRMVDDWAASGLLREEQRERMRLELQVDYRRTNLFLRLTLFLFAALIIGALIGLAFVVFDVEEATSSWLMFFAAAATFYLTQFVISRYRAYRHGVEEAAAVASIVFFAIGCAMFRGDFSSLLAFIGAAGASFIVFRRFGYLYAGFAAVVFAGLIPFNYDVFYTDTPRRLLAAVVLLVIFGLLRERRKDHDPDFPGDLFGVLETTAWVAIYVLANFKVSEWLSIPDEVPLFYWVSYAFTWILPVVGVMLAIGDRHRWMLDANIVMAIVTLMTNKAYLNGVQKPWDPIVFGVLMITIALGLKRWLASGPNGSRGGFIAERLLASERERLALAGGATALAPGAPQPHSHEPPPSFGGGRSGGAGASGKF